MTNSKKIFEKNAVFSKSKIWKLQRDFFENKGIEAWSNQVPFFITSNPFIAKQYAEMTLAFLLDLKKQNLLNKNFPIYILELGTGHGRFSFYFLKIFFEHFDKSSIADFKICYVMSDFTLENLKYWKQHPSLKKYIEDGKLDFSIFNVEKSNSIELFLQKKTIQFSENKNPLIVFANYIFDTVHHDAFSIMNKEPMESLVTIETNSSQINNTTLENIDVTFKNKQIIKKEYYKNNDLNAILQQYFETMNNTHFLIPTGTIQCLDHLLKISNHRLFLIATDEAYSQQSEFEDCQKHKVSFHASISLKVNFHAIGEYFKRKNGQAFLQPSHEGIKTAVFSAGYDLNLFTKTKGCIDRNIAEFHLSDFFNFHTFIKNNLQNLNLRTMISHIKFSQYCPYIFSLLHEKIKNEIEDYSVNIQNTLMDILDRIAENFYFMPCTKNTLIEIADILKQAGKFEKAIDYYEKSIFFFGEDHITYFEIGACYYELNEIELSYDKFKYASTLTIDNDYLIENMKIVSQKMRQKA